MRLRDSIIYAICISFLFTVWVAMPYRESGPASFDFIFGVITFAVSILIMHIFIEKKDV